ncbi:MAG: D-alanine--D-alanine ligase, partial [Verrucomicrobiota bacterium]
MADPLITVLCGGPSQEREVSLVSGRCISEALQENFTVSMLVVDGHVLPKALAKPEETVVFPALHGTFGEDGELQGLLEAVGYAYAGSGPSASALCMDKSDTKAIAAESGFSQASEVTFLADSAPSATELLQSLGEKVVIKPVDQGSSVGLHVVTGEPELTHALSTLEPGHWMAETFVQGREMSVGVLDGEAMGIVEIVPTGGVYDQEHKYTPGMTEYRVPAEMPEADALRCGQYAEAVFSAAGCRDFARVDFILSAAGEPVFLEINTLPGLTPQSLLPKSASCRGLDFLLQTPEPPRYRVCRSMRRCPRQSQNGQTLRRRNRSRRGCHRCR